MDINEILNNAFKVAGVSPGMINGDPRKRYPHGLRWSYYRTKKKPHFKEWLCSYSITRNANYKFCSWLYISERGQYKMQLFREHKRRRSAKSRAYQMLVDRNIYLEGRFATHSQE